MMQPRQRSIDGVDAGNRRRWRTRDHDDRDAERAGGSDLGVGGIATAVLRHHHLDGMLDQCGAFRLHIEGTALEQILRARQRDRGINLFDASDQIEVLWRANEGRQLLTAHSEEDASRLAAEQLSSGVAVAGIDPVIAFNRNPRRTRQHQQRRSGALCRGRRMRGHVGGVRMCGIDQGVNAMITQVAGESIDAAKAARTQRQRLRGRRAGATGERHRRIDVRPRGDLPGEFTRFGGPAQNEDRGLHVHG
jgi:hypothetical protein